MRLANKPVIVISFLMKKLCYPLLGLVVLFVAACSEQQGKNYNKMSVDQNGVLLIKNGLEGGMTEIKASGLAITNSNNQRVIALAKMIIDDHTSVDDSLKKLEINKMILEKDTINGAHDKMIDSLSKLQDASFDRAYLKMMIADHQQAIDLFSTDSKNSDLEIQKFAAKTLPSLRMHLDSAQIILGGMTVGKKKAK